MKKIILCIFLLISINANSQWIQVTTGIGNNSIVWNVSAQNEYVFPEP